MTAKTTIANEPPLPAFVVTTKNYQQPNVDAVPIAQHRIIFADGIAYDFDQQDKNAITVFDPNRNRVVVLDRATQTRCIVDAHELTKMAAEMRAECRHTAAKQQRFGISAAVVDGPDRTFSIQFGGIRVFDHHSSSETHKPLPMEFGQFADWASRLNMARQLGSTPVWSHDTQPSHGVKRTSPQRP